MRASAGATVLRAILLGAIAATLGCGGKQGPAGPSGSTTAQTLTISGATSLRQPGDTGQLTATALFSDGKTKDVTAETTWTGGASPGLGTVVRVSHGLLTAVSYGWANVWASYSIVHASVTVRVGPEDAFFLSGHVTEGGFAVAQAKVEAASASRTLSAMTDETGFYVVPAAGDVTLRVEKDGYQPDVTRLTVSQDQQVDVDIRRTTAPGDIRGIWRLTIIASPSCALPPEATRRDYTARVNQTGQDVTVDVTGSGYIAGGFSSWGFVGSQQGTSLVFKLGSAGSGEYSMAEFFDGSKWLEYSGTAVGPAGSGRIVASFDGTVTFRQVDGFSEVVQATCQASDHRLEFVR